VYAVAVAFALWLWFDNIN